MNKFLLRASRSPFDCLSKSAVPRDKLLPVYDYLSRPGTRNAGNLLFAHAMHKILSVGGASLDVDEYRLTLDDGFASCAPEINDRYDAFIVPLCNSFRCDYRETLERMTRTLKKLTIPCVVTGVGAQLSLRRDFSELESIKNEVKEFVSCVLDRSASIGVRGDVTKEYLMSLGFSEASVDVIGCPSMFYNGSAMSVVKRGISDVAVNYNITGMNDSRILDFTSSINSFDGEVFYLPQVRRLMLSVFSGHLPAKNENNTLLTPMPRVLQPENIHYFFDVLPWIEFMRQRSFSIGTRIHGNVVSLLAGTPAHVVVHDTRTLELSEYFGIPHTLINELGAFDLYETFERDDYRRLNDGHKSRTKVFSDFLERNGLAHGLYDLPGLEAYDRSVVDKRSDVLLAKYSGFLGRKIHLAGKVLASKLVLK